MTKPYTVIGRWPDYMNEDASNARDETFVKHILAADPRTAVDRLRLVLNEVHQPDDPDDIAIIAVFEGHLTNLYEE